MKPIFEQFYCPKCGYLRYINANGICFDCKNEKELEELAKQRKLRNIFEHEFCHLKLESCH